MMFKKSVMVLGLLLLITAGAPVSVFAQGDSGDFEWDWSLYVWTSSIGGNSASGVGFDLDFDQLWDVLTFGLMTTIGFRTGNWSFYSDFIYMDLEKTGVNITPTVILNTDLNAWIINPSIGYSIINSDEGRLEIIGGLRYLWLKTALNFTGAPSVSASDSNWDGIVGLRGELALTDHWYVPAYVDIGLGNSDFTWQGLIGIGYRWTNFSLMAAWRYLYWDLNDDRVVMANMNINGPYFGLNYRF